MHENCAPPTGGKSEGSENEEDVKEASDAHTECQKMEDTFCIVDVNGDEQNHGNSDSDKGSEAGSSKDKDDENKDKDEDTEDKDGIMDTDPDKSQGEQGEADKEDKDSEKGDEEKSNDHEEGPQANIAKQLTGASLSPAMPGVPRPVLMVNGAHAMLRPGIPFIRHTSAAMTSTSPALLTTAGLSARMGMPPLAMAAAVGAAAAQMMRPVFLPGPGPVGSHLPRSAIESIYRQNPPLTNRTVNLASGVVRHASVTAARGGIIRHPQFPGLMLRPAGGLICPLCMAAFSSQDQYLRHLTTQHQRANVF